MRQLHALEAGFISINLGISRGGQALLHMQRLVIHAGEHHLADTGPAGNIGTAHTNLDGLHRLAAQINEGSSLVAHIDNLLGFRTTVVNGDNGGQVIPLLPVDDSHLDRVLETGADDEIVAVILVLCTPAGHQVTIHRVGGRVCALVGICIHRDTSLRRIAGTTILEFPAEIESFTVTGVGAGHAQCQ